MSHRFIDTPAIVWQDTPAIVWGEYTEATPNSFAPVYLVEIVLPETVLNIAFVVANAASPDGNYETPFKTYLESLGHTVTLKSDDDHTWDPTAYDVVLISAYVTSSDTAWLKTVGVGVVTVSPYTNDDLSLASSNGINNPSSTMTILSSANYITREVSGDVVWSNGTTNGYMDTTGGGLKQLAKCSGAASTNCLIIAGEKGALLYDGVTEAGERRVYFAGGIPGDLTTAGWDLFNRCMKWAAYDTESNIKRYATRDFVSDEGYKYRGRLIEAPVIRRSLSGPFYGVERAEPLKLRIADVDNGINKTWRQITAEVEVRGAEVTTIRYDSIDAGYLVEFRGTIADYRMPAGEIVFTANDRDDAALDTLLPKKLVTTDEFTATAMDVGAAVNICFGKCPDVPLRNIQNDTVLNHYDYLIGGYGTHQGLWVDHPNGRGVRRAGVLVETSEYTFYDGSQASPFPGNAFIRFTKEQKGPGNAYFQFTADVYGLEISTTSMERDFSEVIKAILNDSTIGVGEPVNANAFATAKAALANIGDMYCDGAIVTQMWARDILEQLLETCRGSLAKGGDGAWAPSIDGAKVSSLDLGDNDDFWNNFTVEEVFSTPAAQAIKSATVQYAHSVATGKPAYTMMLSVFGTFGVDKTYPLFFVFEHLTAKKVLSYKKNKSIYSDKGVKGRAGMVARRCLRGDVVTLSCPREGIAEKAHVVDVISRSLSEFEVELREYDSRIFDDETITTPTDQVLPTGSSNGPSSQLGVGGNNFPANAVNVFVIWDGTPPTSSVTNGVVLYSEGGELKVRDAAGNIKTLS